MMVGRGRVRVWVATLVAACLIALSVGAVSPAVADSASFADVGSSSQFYTYIQWMFSSGISTGTPNPPGLPLYKPSASVSRQAMASFLFKLSGQSFSAPVTPTFADVDASNPFDTAIEWMAAQGISTGTPQPSGRPLYKPTDPVSRQAMALFLARYAHADVSTVPDNQSFTDVPVTSSPAAAIGWMASSGISTGTPQASGLPLYLPSAAVSRQAMAAFLYRLAHQSLAAPLLETAVAEGLGVQVTWAPNPVTDQVTSYSVTATPADGSSAPSCATPAAETASVPVSNTSVVVTGLCAGVVYTAQVTAVTSAASSPPSAASAPVVPLDAQAPTAPLIASVVPRDGSLQVAWSSPVYNGGSVVTGYSLTATAGSATQTVTPAADASTATISGLTNGTDYTLSLVAVNSIGSSTAASADGTPTTAYAPSAPVGFGATPDGSGNVTLTWQPPADDGGSAITGFVVSYQQVAQASDGSWPPVAGAPIHTVDAAAADTSAAATTFETTNAFYRFSLTATNAIGTGAAATTANPVSPAVDVPTGTVVLTTASVTALSAVTDTSLSWTDPAPAQIQTLVVGDILVAPVATLLPEGALRAIASIADSGGTLTLTTTNATLPQAFTNLSVANTVNPVTGTTGTIPTTSSSKKPRTAPAPVKVARGTFTPAMAGVKLISSDFGGSATLSNSITLGVSIPGVKGEVNVTPSVQVGLEVHQNFVGIPDGVSLTSEAKVVAEAKLDVGLAGDHKFLLGDLAGAPEDIQVGPVPVIVVPKIPIYLTLSGSAGLGISVSVTVGASLSWTSQNPTTFTAKNISTGPKVTAGAFPDGGQGTVSITGSIGLAVQPQADIYDIGGPDFEGDLDFSGTLNFNPPPGEPYLTLGPSLTLKAGIALDSFGFHADLNLTIAKLSFQAFVIDSPPGPGIYTLSPSNGTASVGVPLSLTATRSDGGSSPLTWGLVGSATGDSITSSGVFTAVAPAGRTVSVTVTDASGVTGRTTLTIGNAFSAPGDPTVSQPGAPFTAALHWSAPSSTGGSPISTYRVVTQPATGTHTTTALGLTLTGLTAGTYLANIYAINSAGITSPAATIPVNISARGLLGDSTYQAGAASTVGAGTYNTCAVLADQTLGCWGSNVSFPPTGAFRSVSVGARDACAIRLDGTAACWGVYTAGPRQAPDASRKFKSLSVGDYESCGIQTDGAVYCWGIGQGSLLAGSFVSVSVGRDHACAVKDTGELDCWGSNAAGQLNVPAGTFLSVAAGELFTCGIRTDHAITCWGISGGSWLTPPSGEFVAIDAEGYRACGVQPEGALVCWGNNSFGQTNAPGGQFAAIGVGETHACAIRQDATMVCWGSDGGYGAIPPTDGPYQLPG